MKKQAYKNHKDSLRMAKRIGKTLAGGIPTIAHALALLPQGERKKAEPTKLRDIKRENTVKRISRHYRPAINRVLKANVDYEQAAKHFPELA